MPCATCLAAPATGRLTAPCRRLSAEQYADGSASLPHCLEETMSQTGRRARVVHAIPGRLRIRFEETEPLPASEDLASARVAPGVLAVEAKPAARSVLVQYDPARTTEALVIAELGRAGVQLVQPGEATAPDADATGSKDGGRSALMEMLIGPPPKLDRRFAESLALSAVSLLAARRVGPVLGGGMTLPAYFAIWFALRRMTGLGRRR